MAARGSKEHRKAISAGLKSHHKRKKAAAAAGRTIRKRRSDHGKKKGSLATRMMRDMSAAGYKSATHKRKKSGTRKVRSDKGKKRGTPMRRSVGRFMSE